MGVFGPRKVLFPLAPDDSSKFVRPPEWRKVKAAFVLAHDIA